MYKETKKEAKKETGIPSDLQKQYENYSGYSFDDVQVHYRSQKPKQFNALAYTQGSQVYIAPGQEKHLKHELSHVIQQKRGQVVADTVLKGGEINTDNCLEQEADKIAEKVSASEKEKPVFFRRIQTKNSNGIIQRVLEPDRTDFLTKLNQKFPAKWFEKNENEKQKRAELIGLLDKKEDNKEEYYQRYNQFIMLYCTNRSENPEFLKKDINARTSAFQICYNNLKFTNQGKENIKKNLLSNYLTLFSDEIYSISIIDIYNDYMRELKTILSTLVDDTTGEEETYSEILTNVTQLYLDKIKEKLVLKEIRDVPNDFFIVKNIFANIKSLTTYLKSYYLNKSLYEIQKDVESTQDYKDMNKMPEEIDTLLAEYKSKKAEVQEIEKHIVKNVESSNILLNLEKLKEIGQLKELLKINLKDDLKQLLKPANLGVDKTDNLKKEQTNLFKETLKNEKKKLDTEEVAIKIANSKAASAKIDEDITVLLKNYYKGELNKAIFDKLDLDAANIDILATQYSSSKMHATTLTNRLENAKTKQYNVPHEEFVEKVIRHTVKKKEFIVIELGKLLNTTREDLKDVHATLYFNTTLVNRNKKLEEVYNLVLGKEALTSFHVSTNHYKGKLAIHYYRSKSFAFNNSKEVVEREFSPLSKNDISDILMVAFGAQNVLAETKIKEVYTVHFKGISTNEIFHILKK